MATCEGHKVMRREQRSAAAGFKRDSLFSRVQRMLALNKAVL